MNSVEADTLAKLKVLSHQQVHQRTRLSPSQVKARTTATQDLKEVQYSSMGQKSNTRHQLTKKTTFNRSIWKGPEKQLCWQLFQT